MSTTPRATPVAPAPSRSGTTPSVAEPGRSELLAPVVVVAPDGERELESGSLGIGRLRSADIQLEDPLVSRLHARISVVPDGSILIEDLHSTNGVYVNGVRLVRAVQRLHEGDRLLIGTSELSVFGARRPVLVRARPVELAPGPQPLGVLKSQAPKSEPAPATDRADALQVVGRMAERLCAAGNAAEAIRVLSAHLNKVLLGASAGLAVPEALLDQATHYALLLLAWTENAAWVDYVFELHLAIHQVPSDLSLVALEEALGPGTVPYDLRLYDYFVESLEGRRDQLSDDERARVEHLVRLGPPKHC